jgi:hypothetical protein
MFSGYSFNALNIGMDTIRRVLQTFVCGETESPSALAFTYEELFAELGVGGDVAAIMATYVAASGPAACAAAGLAHNELVAIKLYTSNHIYVELNAALRAGTAGPAAQAYTRLVSEGIARRPWIQTGYLFRGMSFTPAPFLTADLTRVVELRGLTSFSTSQEVAVRFGSGAGGCILHFTTFTGGSDVADVSVIKGESEVLFAPNLLVVVVRSEVDPAGRRHIYLQQVASTAGFTSVVRS